MPSKNLLQTEICSREAHIYDCKCVQGLLIDWSYCTSGAAKSTSGKQLREARLHWIWQKGEKVDAMVVEGSG